MLELSYSEKEDLLSYMNLLFAFFVFSTLKTFLLFMSCFEEKYPTIETLRMEVRNMENPPGGSQGGPARAQI